MKVKARRADSAKVKTLSLGQNLDTWKSQLEPKSNKWSFRWSGEVQRLSAPQKWLKDKRCVDGFLRAWEDGSPLLKRHIGTIWCARYSRRMVSIMARVVMTVCFYGLFPREWMDVLSPPIMPPSQLRRSDNTRNNLENLIIGTVTLILALFASSCPLRAGRLQTIRRFQGPALCKIHFCCQMFSIFHPAFLSAF